MGEDSRTGVGLWRQCLGDSDTSSCQTVLSPETVTRLEHVGPGGLHAVAAGHGSLPPQIMVHLALA